MPMPKSVKVGPLTYTIQHDHAAVVEYTKTDGTDVYGCCQNRICNMLIDEGYPLAREQTALLHELVHAIHCVADLAEWNLKTDDDHYVRLFSGTLLDVFQCNPDLVNYLMEKSDASQKR